MLISTYYLFFIINVRRIVRPQNNPAMKTTPTTLKATIIKYLLAGERDIWVYSSSIVLGSIIWNKFRTQSMTRKLTLLLMRRKQFSKGYQS